MKSVSPTTTKSLFQWIWQAFFRTALTPLLLVEVVLILAYVASNNLVRDENLAAIRTVAKNEVTHIANRETVLLNEKVRSVTASVSVLADAAALALRTPLTLVGEEKARALSAYTMSAEGTYYRLHDDGGSAVYYSGVMPIGEQEREKVLKTERLDPLMRSILRSNPLWVQTYLNTFDSLNRIYPFLDVQKTFPPKMDIPTYNFYYEADAKHNPKREVVWTDVYVDPAGQGWTASCIAPVYDGDKLEGVLGADITVAKLVKEILDFKIPWEGYGMLIGRTGTILALPAGGEEDFNLVELTNHDYQAAILKDTFKPESFNIFKRTDLGSLPSLIEQQTSGITTIDFHGETNDLAWSTVQTTGWKLLIVVPQSKIDTQALTLSKRIGRLAVFMVVGLVVFYSGFFAFLWHQARRMSRRIADPLTRINDQVHEISKGNYKQAALSVGVAEIDETSGGVVEMGKQLGEDHTALLQTQEDLVRAKDLAEAAALAKSEFLARMSHEIRTPMNGVLGMTELLQATPLSPTQIEYADIIQSSARGLLAVINDILDFSKIDAGKLELVKETFHLGNLLESTLDMVAQRAQENGLDLVLALADDVPINVMGDAGRLRQVLLNLLSNAVKFTDQGEAFTKVSLAAETEKTVTLRFEIRDTGVGIDPENHERIFDVFAQADGTSTRRHGGTGLGLAIAKQIVRLMDGEIGVESALGKGTTFWFSAKFDKAQTIAQPEPTNNEAAGLRALVVDDNETCRTTYAQILKSWGAEVDTAEGSGVALGKLHEAVAKGRPYDFVMVDRDMPGMSGEDLVVSIQASPRLVATPILLLSPVSKPNHGPQSSKNAATLMALKKPLHREALEQAVSIIVARRAGESAPKAKEAASQTQTRASAPANKINVLLAEDNAINRKVATAMLEALGCTVVCASNGLEALACVKREDFSVVFMDCQMPEMDGYSATKEIRKFEAESGKQRTPIVALTANALTQDRERSIAAGMDDHIAKPMQRMDLEHALIKYVGSRLKETRSTGAT